MSGYELVGGNVSVAVGLASPIVHCPARKKVVGGGAEVGATSGNTVTLLGTGPQNDSSWYAFVDNRSTSPKTILLQAICISA